MRLWPEVRQQGLPAASSWCTGARPLLFLTQSRGAAEGVSFLMQQHFPCCAALSQFRWHETVKSDLFRLLLEVLKSRIRRI